MTQSKKLEYILQLGTMTMDGTKAIFVYLSGERIELVTTNIFELIDFIYFYAVKNKK